MFWTHQNKPFRGPHNKKRCSYRKRPYGDNSSQSSKQLFSSGGGKPNSRGSSGRFRSHPRGRVETPPPNDSSKASLSPPVGGHLHSFRRDWKLEDWKQMFRQCIKHYHQWLSSAIHLKTKIDQSSPDSFRIQGPSQRTSSVVLHPVSSVAIEKGVKCKISRVLQSPVSSPQASP